MSELIQIIWEHLRSDDGPQITDEYGYQATDAELLTVAQGIAEAIVAAGWPRTT